MDIQERLEQWANETVEMYHKLAITDKKYNFNFYTQSDLKTLTSSPEILIVGLNPGSGGCYILDGENEADKLKEKKETFIKGNPFYCDHKRWRMWIMLHSILNKGGLGELVENDSKFAWTNIVCMNTPNMKTFPKELFNICAKSCVDLINKISPKIVLCLGKDAIESLCKEENLYLEDIVTGEIKRAQYGKIIFIGIPHTSKFYSNEEMDLVGNCIKMIYDNPTIEKDKILAEQGERLKNIKNRKTEKSHSKEFNLKVESLFNKRYSQYNSKTDLRHNYWYYPFGEGKIQICVYHGQKCGDVHILSKYSSLDTELQNKIEKAKDFLVKKCGYFTPENPYHAQTWLGYKTFREYEGNTAEEKTAAIITEMDLIIKVFRNLGI
ncbi:MAG: hypothetical protein IKO90_00905 [Bacteroidales bacterium]|nr:hypothetical protein [Bacteroidales bacterium]MBR7035291.1 hypothetical protein [Bacteroidales bacterium]